MKSYRFIAILMAVCWFSQGFAIQEHWSLELHQKKEFDSAPPAFEKVYVSRAQILSMQDGIYLKTCCGSLEKVRALLEDTEGLYVLLIETQCPLCGLCYKGKEPPEGMSCPLYEKTLTPLLKL